MVLGTTPCAEAKSFLKVRSMRNKIVQKRAKETVESAEAVNV
jgi:hypothetical protein